ncbi:hypothetical protein [Candidatus Blastococcus massiliensis]|uniref:hypothetical protein n=1 Tax=Candidatus Blastococcus massiliensis TaxID=1470358 RepID=UPI0012DE70E4|nr:hypothetical protein [Candidatus Blastococcus massiliensis]
MIERIMRRLRPPVTAAAEPSFMGVEPVEVRVALLQTALAFLHADSMQSREMQQRALAWYGTVLAGVVFGGLVYANPERGEPNSVVLFILFAVAAPGVSVIANLVYLGELLRLGRAAVIWRSLERHTLHAPNLHIRFGSEALPPLFTESAYARIFNDKLTRGYGSGAYYLSMLALFAGGWALSFSVGIPLLWNAGPSVEVFSQSVPMVLISFVGTLVLWGASTYRICRRILALAGRVVNFPDLLGHSDSRPDAVRLST